MLTPNSHFVPPVHTHVARPSPFFSPSLLGPVISLPRCPPGTAGLALVLRTTKATVTAMGFSTLQILTEAPL